MKRTSLSCFCNPFSKTPKKLFHLLNQTNRESMTARAADDSPPSKRRKTTHGGGAGSQDEDGGGLIEGLPDHVAEICLSLVHRPLLLSAVCARWRRLVRSTDFTNSLSMYVMFADSDPGHPNPTIRFMCFDPISSSWDPIPDPVPPESSALNLIVYRHPAFMSRKFAVQSVSAAGKLILLSGSTSDLSPAMSRPLVFDPAARSWSSGPAIETPRRWCAAGTYAGSVYVASGIGSRFAADVAKSIEKWDTTATNGDWEKMSGLKDGRFSREAIEAVGWRGRLLMVNTKGDAAKEGIVYDLRSDSWREMAVGMVAGWKGPVAADGEDLYGVDEEKGRLRRYREVRDDWKDVVVESDERLRGAQQIVAARGKICVVTDGGRIVVVDVEETPARIWTVETPLGLEPVAVHVLPRMSRLAFC